MNIIASTSSNGGSVAGLIVVIAWYVILVIGGWLTFQKAGVPGWKSIIPFYNTYVACRIAGVSGWWFLTFFIPIVDIFTGIWIAIKFAKSYGYGAAFGFFLIAIFQFVGVLIIGFGPSRYEGTKHA